MDRPIPLDAHDQALRKEIVAAPMHALISKAGDIWVPVRTNIDIATYRYLPLSLAPCRSWVPVKRTAVERHYGLLTPLCSIVSRPEVGRMPILFCNICHLHPLRSIDCTVCRSYWWNTILDESESPYSTHD